MRTEQELKQLAIDIIEGKVFGTWNLKHPEDVGSIFMGMIFLDSEQKKKLVSDNIVHFYEYLDKAGPLSVNGMPTFFNMHLLAEEEVDILQSLIEQFRKQKEVFLKSS